MVKVLVADDSNIERKKIAAILKKNNYTVSFAKTGEEAITQAFDNRPDLIIMDFVMPDVDGVVASDYLKSNSETKGIPIIMVTSMRKKQEVIEALRSGINDFLLKPYTRDQLLTKIKYQLEQNVA